MAEEKKKPTWEDIKKLMDEGERETKEYKKLLEERLKEDIKRRERLKKKRKQEGIELPKPKPYKPPSSVDEFSEKTEEEIDKYIIKVERETQKELGKLRKQEIKYLRKGGGLLGTPSDDYFRVKHRRKLLEELVRALKRTWGGLEEELQFERLEPDYKPAGLLSRMWDYITRHSKKFKKVYLTLFVLCLIFLIFRNKSVIGYVVLESVANSNYLSYFLVFILIICLITFYKLDKDL